MSTSSQPRVENFHKQRTDYIQVVSKYATQDMKRFFGIDSTTYAPGALDKKTKELLGLATSLVLRCDDCILYHLIESHKAGVTSQELSEAVSIAMLVGGSITIPHIRRMMDIWDKELAPSSNP